MNKQLQFPIPIEKVEQAMAAAQPSREKIERIKQDKFFRILMFALEINLRRAVMTGTSVDGVLAGALVVALETGYYLGVDAAELARLEELARS